MKHPEPERFIDGCVHGAEMRVAAYYADMDAEITEALHEHWLRGQPPPPRWVRACQRVSRLFGGASVFGHRDLT